MEGNIPLPPPRGGALGHPFVRAASPVRDDDFRGALARFQQQFDDARDADGAQFRALQDAQVVMQQEQLQIRTAQDNIADQLQQIRDAILARPFHPPPPPPPPPPPAGARNAGRVVGGWMRHDGAVGGVGDVGGTISSGQKPLHVSGLEPMDLDIKLQDFATWRNRWNDLCRLQQVHLHPLASQTAALRQALGLPMQRVVEIALNIRADGPETPDEILDKIHRHLRSKRNVALDRVDFETCAQQAGKSFNEFFIRLKRIADCALLCDSCIDQRMTTRIMSGIRDSDVRKRLMSLTPFPMMDQAVNLCRNEESA